MTIGNLKPAIDNRAFEYLVWQRTVSMANRKAILISNPRTGRYAARARIPIEQIHDRLTSLGLDTELINTNGPGHAAEIAARAAQNGTTDVIVAGGDGTINEAIQGMAGTHARLGIIPRGTANVLARELRLPADESEATDVVARGRSRTIHFGVAIDEATQTHRYFLLMAGIGVDAAVVNEVPPSLKRRFGKAAFWFSGFRHLTRWNPPVFTVEIDSQQYQATFVAIGNAASYGGDLAITPRARIDDDEFEVCIIQTKSRLRYLHLASKALSHRLKENSSYVRFLPTNSVKAFGEAAVQVDGEVIGKLPMRFEIAPDSLEVIVP